MKVKDLIEQLKGLEEHEVIIREGGYGKDGKVFGVGTIKQVTLSSGCVLLDCDTDALENPGDEDEETQLINRIIEMENRMPMEEKIKIMKEAYFISMGIKSFWMTPHGHGYSEAYIETLPRDAFMAMIKKETAI